MDGQRHLLGPCVLDLDSMLPSVLKNVKVRFKIEKVKYFEPTLRCAEQFWINLVDGRYFWVARGHAGSWYDSHTSYTYDYPSMEAAIIEGLIREYSNWDGHERYKRIQAKEQVYTISLPAEGKRERVLGKRKQRR